MKPDVYIEVRFRTTKEGGRKMPLNGEFYTCPLMIDNQVYDCRLLIRNMKLELGLTYIVPVKFLNRELILPKLAVGKCVILWEGKEVADAKVIEIC